MSTHGHSQAAVDDMELWVIAAILNPGNEDGQETEEAFMERSQREAAARGASRPVDTP